MRERALSVVLAVTVAGLLLAGCGDGETATSTSSSSSTTAESGPPSPDEIYNECIRQLAETSVTPEAAQLTCTRARALFSECRIEASGKTGNRHDEAIAACEQEAAEGLEELADSAAG